jgi:hypothetical protein
VLMRGINLARDLRATGDASAADELHDDCVGSLQQLLGATHPEVAAIEAGLRAEGDIEAPPT